MLGVLRDASFQELVTKDEAMLRCPSSPVSLFPSLLVSGMKRFPTQETKMPRGCAIPAKPHPVMRMQPHTGCQAEVVSKEG